MAFQSLSDYAFHKRKHYNDKTGEKYAKVITNKHKQQK